MNTIKNVCLFLFLSVSIALSQDIQIQWAKTYDYESDGHFIFTYDEGLFFITGGEEIVSIDNQGAEQNVWSLDPDHKYEYMGDIVFKKCNEGYIITGSIRLEDENKIKVLLKKLDNQGQQEWEKLFFKDDYISDYDEEEANVSVNNYGGFVKQTRDNGYILFCKGLESDSFYFDGYMWIIKTNPYGEKEWDYKFGTFGHHIALHQTSDDGYLVAYSKHDDYDGDTDHLLRLTPDGKKEWDYTFSTDRDVKSIQPTSDDGYLVAYNRDNDSGNLLRLTADGQEVWEKSYKELLGYTKPADDGGFYIYGNNHSKDNPAWDTIYLKKVAENGDEIWKKTFQGDMSYAWFYNMIKLDDNGYLLYGHFSEFAWHTGQKGWLIKTDNSGNKIWEKTFTSINSITQILKISPNKFILAGHKDGYKTIIKVQETTENSTTFELLSPVNNKSGTGTQLVLDWTPVDNASSYLVELDDNRDMSSLVISKTVSNESNCIVDGLSYSTQYYWKVRAQFPDGSGYWTESGTFKTMPPPHIEFNDKEYNMSYVDAGDQYYTDREYTITDLPDPLKNCLWIKIPNSEKYSTDDNYIQFQLKRDATIYIAYDNRASAVPVWLSSEFEKTEYTIENTDEESNFNVWKGQFAAGDVTLGANLANGAEGVLTNYVVLIDIPTQMLDPRHNKTGIGNDLYFSWEPLGNFGPYDIKVSENQDMSNPLYHITNIEYARYKIRDLDYNKDYYWRIKAHNRNDENAWYQTRKFHTMDDPNIRLWGQQWYTFSWLEENDQYYNDRNDVVLSIPDPLKNLLWIKTDNDDAANDSNDHLEFRLYYNATLYVGFDSRATSLPNWVTDDFSNTGLTITVSDSAKELNIWSKNFNNSWVALGSNMAKGAENIKSHYVVLIDTNQVQPISAHFGSDVTSGALPLTVNFADSSQGLITAWEWDFGDGTTSTEKNPSHTYENTGNYSVSLTVHAPDSSDTIIKENYITVKNVIANFSADVTTGQAPLTVSFTDSSLGEIDSWLWKFGDGLTSTSQNPTHVYTSGDSFTVSLFVRNSSGSNTMVKSNYIIVDHPTSIDDMAGIPDKFDLLPNYPNPFNPQTTIRFAVPKRSFVKLTIYDINGKQVQNLFSGTKNPGNYAITWNASGFSSGMYFIKMNTDTYSSVRKCMLVK